MHRVAQNEFHTGPWRTDLRLTGRREFAMVSALGHRVGGVADFHVPTGSPRYSVLLMAVRGFRYLPCNSPLGFVYQTQDCYSSARRVGSRNRQTQVDNLPDSCVRTVA
jgi:hypothetical protein